MLYLFPVLFSPLYEQDKQEASSTIELKNTIASSEIDTKHTQYSEEKKKKTLEDEWWERERKGKEWWGGKPWSFLPSSSTHFE